MALQCGFGPLWFATHVAIGVLVSGTGVFVGVAVGATGVLVGVFVGVAVAHGSTQNVFCFWPTTLPLLSVTDRW